MGKRRKGRELALQYLYQWDFHGPESIDPLDCFWESRTEQDSVKKFAINIIDGVKKHVGDLDIHIESQSKHWKLYRMSRIDRNILRMAVFEFIHCEDVPPKVSIDEAIEIGKKFGASESGAFINGILDQISKKLGKIKPGVKND
jgi:transcription antitermination factor NusB